ncbi:MAG TPA: PVC-type heme-binding CxxCH protein [Gemmataceae bacterium]|nr:PVC-type heme-binding CxxCH protein [Gemmataceae bacterium]
MNSSLVRFLVVLPLLILPFILARSGEPFDNKPIPARSSQEEQKTFQLHPGFRIELVACEPQIMDPVAMTFDQDGRLYVAEMRGYPNEGYGTGNITSGCIKLLEDRDGDGFYETSTVFADGLRFPMSIQPWGKGIIVSVAPDIIYFEDTKGTGKADVKKVLYTGFGLDNIQQLLNSLQWGMDNWVYGCNGASGGTIRSLEKLDAPPVVLSNRGIRFHPEVPGSLEPMSGGGQYGLSPDAWQNWFVNTNTQHLRQIILPDQYLRRNPGMTVSATTFDIPEHGPACKVYRISPFEQWRVERTQRRKTGPDSARFPSTELVPGGYITSACSPLVYEADRYPKEYQHNVFLCEPANNLVMRDSLEEKGSIFTAKRPDKEKEFFASTDTWCRPVHLSLGPDGCIYMVDFYREVIETPRSLPDDMKPKLVLKSQERGRIWRIVPEGEYKPRKPQMSKMSSAELVPLLADPNIWWRLNAQRLLVERQDKTVVAELRKLAQECEFVPGQAHALWTLKGLAALEEADVVSALQDQSSAVRGQALRLAEKTMSSPRVREIAVKLADDSSAPLRLQAAFSLGADHSPEITQALGRLIRRDGNDPWIAAAVLSSSYHCAAELLDSLMRDGEFAKSATPAQRQIVVKLASQIGATGSDADFAKFLQFLADPDRPGLAAWQSELLQGLSQGLQNTNRALSRLWQAQPENIKKALARLRPQFEQAARNAGNKKMALASRLAATRLLAQGPFELAGPVLKSLLAPQLPPELQMAAVRSLAMHEDSSVPATLIEAWSGAGPAVRREIQEALFARPERLPALLDALEAKHILPNQLDSLRVNQLRSHADTKVKERAAKLLAGALDPDRQKVVVSYKPALDLKGDAAKGQALFRKQCATCHRVDNVGFEIGPDLRAAVRDKTSEQLLISILDPSREVDRRYTVYLIETKSGRQISGIVAVDSATSVVLRRAEKAEDTVLRTQIETMTDTGKSLMPDGLEKDLNKQDVADVIAYLMNLK